ncbi:type 1 glutamine amidotransferase domain-containing protein [Mycobacteroides salmoniphilum]|uniref:type 1 glutamine amidotransferase domain-containing protein n=1 Tax=Mycobacteroides salmoniphilum TaxID=404941 RepID=UPI0010659E1D|nr:type 1 glutamine amidotransferase domain-containing protein [Mycobacteroides salmoniphilum]TDZ99317.1 DJ-1/PfpI family protein [Mycobacteroides salmoniphilum]
MIVFLLPDADYDPTEAALPWVALDDAGIDVRFATPTGTIAHADRRLTELGFSLLSPVLMTRADGLAAYDRMSRDANFLSPMAYADVREDEVSGVFVPGGHAPGMRSMLDSTVAQDIFGRALLAGYPVGAVCHGVLLAARARNPETGFSVLYDRRTTAVTALLELSAWNLTRPWLGRYYRTYPQTVQAEVTAALKDSSQFRRGPLMPLRDMPSRLNRGFTVADGNYISARWPGDCHRLAAEFRDLVVELS